MKHKQFSGSMTITYTVGELSSTEIDMAINYIISKEDSNAREKDIPCQS